MDVSNLLSNEPPICRRTPQMAMEPPQQQQRYHQYPTRHSISSHPQQNIDQRYTTPPASLNYTGGHSGPPTPYDPSPSSPTPKHVAFELMIDESPTYRARLPMRVQIFPHDTTDSIVTTVKNFYGLYEGAAQGVSFEDEQGNTLIARYENFKNNMVVYVRVIPDYSHPPNGLRQRSYHSASPVGAHKVAHLDGAPLMLPPQLGQAPHYTQPASRPNSRLARMRSASPPSGRGRRSASIQKGRSRSGVKSRGSSAHGSFRDINSDPLNGDSGSDGGHTSVTSSRKAKSEQLASAEISLDNILEGGRRKRAKFESSELPLFVPPQVPMTTSISSVSPQRRTTTQEGPSPFARPTQRTFAYNYPAQSPQSYGYGEQGYGLAPQTALSYTTPVTAPHGHRLRDRSSFPPGRSSSGMPPVATPLTILPTPDPTIASCISDEDVALQLMRLGDTSNISHGRTSASTLDDALSGVADVASSATSESGDYSDDTEQVNLPREIQPKIEPGTPAAPSPIKKKQNNAETTLPSLESTEPSGDDRDAEYQIDKGALKSEQGEQELGQILRHKAPKSKTVANGVNKTRVGSMKAPRVSKPRPAGSSKKSKLPISPTSLPPQSRKQSTASTLSFQHQLAVDEEDLSSKPRCQRCRKSKKGCDRQRPCQRCKDAGIGADGCVSEDEGNGRKGRYGRHMGVPVKKGCEGLAEGGEAQTAGAVLTAVAGTTTDKSKKRKR